MTKTLKELSLEHKGKVTDKWSLYLEEWDRIFAQYQDQHINLLEIGIQNGGSLEIWAKYFINARKIIGCDIDPKCELLEFDDDRIKIVVGDANTNEIENQITQNSSTFDIIIDDGSHISGDVIRSFVRYFPHLNDGGIYVVEDIHSSYWKNYEGGLHNPFSSMGFFKRLADIVNYEHWRTNKPRVSLLDPFVETAQINFDELTLTSVHSIEFINSMCIIRKLPPENNVLGKRVVSGINEIVTDGFLNFNNSNIQDISVIVEDDENLDPINLIAAKKILAESLANKEERIKKITNDLLERDRSINSLNEQIREGNQIIEQRNGTIQTLTDQISERDAEIISYVTSRSWRFTRPFRRISNFLKRILNA